MYCIAVIYFSCCQTDFWFQYDWVLNGYMMESYHFTATFLLHTRVNGVSFLCRSPSDSRIRAKTIYAVSRNQFRHELDGVHFEIQATDPDDMDLEVLRGRANRT